MSAIQGDTTFEAACRQNEVLRRIGIASRAAMTFELSDNLRRIVEDGVRDRHPDWDEQAIRLERIRLMLGDDLFRRAYGKRDAG